MAKTCGSIAAVVVASMIAMLAAHVEDTDLFGTTMNLKGSALPVDPQL